METEASLDMYINTLKEMLLDEEKLVTYVSLSKDLCIHINSSKKLLCRAIESIVKEQANLQLNVNYIISGLSDINIARTTVCTDQELNDVRKTFKTIFFEHVYSVSKSTVGVGDVAYLLINKFEDFSLCKGYIKSDDCIKHTSTDIEKIKNTKLELKPDDNKSIAAPSKKMKQENKANTGLCYSNKGSKSTSDISVKSEPSVKCEVISPKKQSNGTSPKKQMSKSSPKKLSNGKQNHKMQKRIAGFFTKSGTSRKTSTEVKDIEIDSKQTVCNEVEKMDVQDTKQLSPVPVTNNETEKENKKTDLNKKTNSLSQIKKSSKVDKKRKRVLQVSDSDSEEENDSFTPNKQNVTDSEDEIPPTPMSNNIKITSGLVNPKKKRKIVDKTFMEEGYIVTKKVEVYESCSENEEEAFTEKKEECKDESFIKVKEVKVETSPSKNNGSKRKKKSPVQKGQSTLTTFFKRK